MKKAYKYKLNLNKTQKQTLDKAFGCVRFIYNWGLDKKKEAWLKDKKGISYFELSRELPSLKKDGKHEWLKDCPSESIQQSLRCLDNAFTNFFKKKTNFPRFKSKKRSKQSIKFVNNIVVDFEKYRVKVLKLGWLKLRKNREFDVKTCKIGTVTISKDRCGDYWCVILVDDNAPVEPKAKVEWDKAVGIDMGIKSYATLSDGTKIGNPKFLEKELKHLKRLQQSFSKKQIDSNRREVARIKIAKLYRKITNKQEDFINKLASYLVKSEYTTFCVEDLNITGMTQNHNLAKSISSAAWGKFIRQLEYKSEWAGKSVIKIGRFDPSSKMCNNCGYRNQELKLTDREWVCPVCGEKHDRDVNAAINIKKMALHPQSLSSGD